MCIHVSNQLQLITFVNKINGYVMIKISNVIVIQCITFEFKVIDPSSGIEHFFLIKSCLYKFNSSPLNAIY